MSEEPVMLGEDHDPARYDYLLPEERIARRPVSPRDASRLLVLHRRGGTLSDAAVRDLPGLLAPGDLVVVNETRVVPARLTATHARLAREVEMLLIREASPKVWLSWAKPARRLRPGDTLQFPGSGAEARVVERHGESVLVRFEGEIAPLLADRGRMPIPPYLGRPDDARDRDDYQTVYARVPGAVAAPTAGLHFTPELLERLESAGIGVTRVILHVGPGTFRPIRVSDLREHRVEAERFSVPPEAVAAIGRARGAGGRIVAVGTTTTRALESWAREAPGMDRPLEGSTELTIVPPFPFRVVDALLTNFHLPRSSLLLLVAAFAGRATILSAYEEAVRRGYRFYSYGDAMMIL